MSDDPASAEAFRWELEQAIERLKKTRDALTEERDELVRISNKLTRERDEARRLYCRAVEEIEHGMTNETERMVADYLGWDCFNDNKNA